MVFIRPVRAKAFIILGLLPLQGDSYSAIFPQGVALGYELIAPSGRYRVTTDNHLSENGI
jgi:hypothetical protein